MKIGTLFGDLVRSLLRRPATRCYPFERAPTPERLRGALRWEPARCMWTKDAPSPKEGGRLR